MNRDYATTLHDWLWSVWTVIAAFGAYFCMYGVRKPYTAASFEDAAVLGVSFKVLLLMSQVGGYMVSKFLGIKIVSELAPRYRAAGILAMVAFAEAALFGFALTPRPWNAAFLFLNGLPLGMVFGLVLGFLEGRRATEALTAGLCASFILADGVTKSVAFFLLERGISEDWMPAVAGLIFLGPLIVFVGMLAIVPPPDKRDIAARSERSPMSAADRRQLFRKFAFGLSAVTALYLLITILRSIRADFASELWTSMGVRLAPSTFTTSELYVALGVLVVNGALVLVHDNRRAFFASLAVCGIGVAIFAAAAFGKQFQAISPYAFMVLVGLGLYFPYVAVHCTVFERFMAMTRDKGTIGFLMYVADSIGYLGYVIVMLWHNLRPKSGGSNVSDFADFFLGVCFVAAALSSLCIASAWRYFAVRCPGDG